MRKPKPWEIVVYQPIVSKCLGVPPIPFWPKYYVQVGNEIFYENWSEMTKVRLLSYVRKYDPLIWFDWYPEIGATELIYLSPLSLRDKIKLFFSGYSKFS